MRVFFRCLLVCSLILSGCSEKEESSSITLNVNVLVFEPEGGSQTIAVSSNEGWSVSGETEWCTVSPKSGTGISTVTISVSENESPEELKTTLFFKCGSANAKVELTQKNYLPGQEIGVWINGVKWATRNVDKPGTFAAKPEDPGMFYQWNRKIGWSATNPMTNSNGGTTWDSSIPTGTVWIKANDPSPAGWRVPTSEEIDKLFDNEKVARVWTTENGKEGGKFTDKSSRSSIFLPVAGYRGRATGALDRVDSHGYYWSSTQDSNSDKAYYFGFHSDGLGRGYSDRGYGQSVRPVKE